MERNENLLSNLGSKFTKELEAIVQKVLVERGVKNNADLVDSIEWQYTRDSLQMVVNEYYQYVSTGRKPRARKIPLYALINFIKKNKITSTKYNTGQLAYMMQLSIYKNGIKGKNFIDQVQNTVTDTVEIRVADDLEQFLSDSLFTSFKIK